MKKQPLRLWRSLSLRSQLQLTLLICYIDVYALLCRHLEGFNRASNPSLCASLMCPSCTSVSRSVRSAAAVVEIAMQPVVKVTIATNFSAHLHRFVCSLLQALWRFQQSLQTLSMCIFDVFFPYSIDWHICESKEQPVKLMHTVLKIPTATPFVNLMIWAYPSRYCDEREYHPKNLTQS